MKKKVLKKAQKGTHVTSSDSTSYYKNKEKSYKDLSKLYKGDTEVSKFNKNYYERLAGKAVSDQLRQYHKGKPGFDKLGNPIKKKTGGAVRGKKK